VAEAHRDQHVDVERSALDGVISTVLDRLSGARARSLLVIFGIRV